MAEEQEQNISKFLKWQDSNSDGLVDKCDDIIDVAPAKKCPTCQPNPNYIAPNWRKRESFDPWINEKFCRYQIAVLTRYRTLSETDIEDIFAEYESEAIEGLLVGFDKADTMASRATLEATIDHQQYDLDARPLSYLKLLYSVSFDDLANLPGTEEEDDDQEEEEEEDTSPIVVEMVADDIQGKMIRFRKAMNLYSRYYRVYSYIEKGSIVFEESNKMFTVAQFDRYGDAGLFPNSTMAQVMLRLNAFLNGKGLNIFGVGPISFGRDRVLKIEFTWSYKYKLTKMRVWTEGCGEKPFVYKKKRLNPLNGQSSWKDRTAMGYFSKLDQIDNRLNAKQSIHWLEIIKEFTYPKVYETFTFPDENPDPQTALSCMGDALASNLGELGQDIMDDVLGIGDAVAYQFHKSICQNSMNEFQEEETRLGFVIDPKTGQPRDLMSMATEQAFKELADDEQVFVHFCAMILASFTGISMDTSAQKMLDQMYAEGFDRIKLCGLFDFMMDAISCLMGGLSLEEALSRIIKSALRAMSIDNLGDFFIGLPPDKQAELEALVTKKIESGDIFKDASGAAAEGGAAVVSDTVSGKLKWTAPWKTVETAAPTDPQGASGTNTRHKTVAEQQDTSEGSRRTLAQQFDVGKNAENELSPNVVLEAYILALIDVYKDDLLSVVDLLNKYPGAQMIAKVIAMFDCPRPPIFDPSVLDFIKDLSLPWCRSQGEMAIPRLSNPFGWIPKFKDITAFLWYALKIAIQKAIIAIVVKILVKVCEMIGDALCKALEVVGDVAASLPAIATGKTTFREAIKDSICGDSASEEELDDTITEMFEKLGIGGAALADKQAVIDFTEDLSSAVTRREMMGAFLGDTSEDMATAAYNIIQFEYPQFADAFPNRDAIKDFMGNCGTLMPEDVKQAMRDFVDELPPDDQMPANPSLCATPQQLEDFQELRCTLLEGRATPEQCRQMFDNLQDDMGEDLESLMGSIQQGIMPDLNSPDSPLGPLVSAPGCDDGLIPFESDEAKNVAKIGLGSEMKSLKKDYADDMLGNGGLGAIFGADKGWGLMNLVLADTMGQPLTAHWRKAANRPSYVDFVTDDTEDAPNEDEVGIWPFIFPDPSPTVMQNGNFPYKVAGHLQDEFKDLDSDLHDSIDFSLTNDWKKKTVIKRSYEELGFEGLFGSIDIDRLAIPDFGYNVKFETNNNAEKMEIILEGRKKTPDIKLKFRDLNKGRDTPDAGSPSPTGEFAYGFNLGVFLADLEKKDGKISSIGTYNEPVDTARIKITNVYNPSVAFDLTLKNSMSRKEWKAYLDALPKGDAKQYERLFEFLAVEDTLADVSPLEFPTLCACFEEQRAYSPLVYALGDLIAKHNPVGALPNYNGYKSTIDDVTEGIYTKFAGEIGNNNSAFLYGAKYDTLSEEDAEYVVKKGQTLSPGGTIYREAEILDDDGDRRGLRNRDMIMGVSRDQLRNGDKKARVVYLDPMTYGGSYTNPGVYVKPLKYEGYLGMINVMFPDFSPCKPRNTDLVDFGSIEKEISDTYNNIPDDQRLKSDPDCVTEVPYNRILERPSKAAIQGLIRAACRIYASAHFLKTFATFSLFKPDFKTVYGSMYPQYVVENMERSMREPGGSFWELFNTFKNDEFWYAFLEQAVQTYGRLVDTGEIVNPPEAVLHALFRINDAQEDYKYPQITSKRSDVELAHNILETTAPYRWPLKSRGLRLYRGEKNLEAVQATEEDAKIILNEFMIEELNYMGEKFMDNLKAMDVEPKYTDMGYYVLSKMCQGANDLDLDKEIVEEAQALPDSGDSHYTSGGELAMADGSAYVGYYHTNTDDDNNVIYMEGEFHTSEEHEALNPFAHTIKVPIGDVAEIGSSYSFNAEQPFVIEKYISVNGTKMSPTAAISTIKANDSSLNISDVYPGTMEQVVNDAGQVEGISGELGVRYGLLFSVMSSGKKILAQTEISSLDLKIGQMAPLQADSKLLLCLINQLKESSDFKIATQYIFPFKKTLSTLAIYNDMGFLPSIGEKTVPNNLTKPTLEGMVLTALGAPDVEGHGHLPDFDSKPGAKTTFPKAKQGNFTPDYSDSNDKWASLSDRTIFTPFNLDWDDWDQTLLRNSKSRIKKLFKQHYYGREFNSGDAEGSDFTKILIKNLKGSFTPATGKRILPWFKRRNLRDNPFNAKGELCTKFEK